MRLAGTNQALSSRSVRRRPAGHGRYFTLVVVVPLAVVVA
jgi:hypothetical protein